MKKLTTEEFINRAKKVHGDKYDYSKVKYVNSQTKVVIICPIHGIFKQRPNEHNGKQKQGCPSCGGVKKLTTEEFINRAKKVHGDKYDYSLVEWVNFSTKVDVICPTHGTFKHSPKLHLRGNGCGKCAKRILTKDMWISKSNEIHQNKYVYTFVNYDGNKTKVKIKCPKHGVFEQRPNDHYYNGCPECNPSNKYTLKEFLHLSKKVHGDKYDYSLVEWVNVSTKVKIKCPKHGVFEQMPKCHYYSRNGCPTCQESKGEKEIRLLLDKYNITYKQQHRFKDCKDNLPLPFDFYLPNKNICIEFDGIQHIESIKFFGGDEKFHNRKHKDNIKNQYCKENGISLIRIQYNENIHNVIKDVLVTRNNKKSPELSSRL